MFGGGGRFVIVGEGETIDKIDFSLVRGGVITGRITDADGRPVVEERVQLSPADNSARARFGAFSNPYMYQTDDRGIYRLYGIAPGRYTLSVGVSPQDGMVRVGMASHGYYPKTFYPGETDIKKASVIEVTEGGEIKDVDIKLGKAAKGFSASGRVIDADTGRPVPNVMIGYGTYNPADNRMMSFGYGQTRTDARGQFILEGIVPGRFAAFVWTEDGTYSDAAKFEITDSDVSGLELKLRRGATISGTVQLEGSMDKSVLARLSQLSIGVSVQTKLLGVPEGRPATINPDGSFRLTGLPPGRASLFLYGYPPPKDIRVARVERDGAPQPNGIEITPGAEITNVRVIFEYGSATIRGQLRVENGELPDGARVFVFVLKSGAEPNTRPAAYTQADARGRFIIEGLATGEYQIRINAYLPPEGNAPPNRRPLIATQNVSVANGVETEATITLDLANKGPEVKEK
jgi:protocatechuate 3,4-dioxygenase beta subunit